MKTLRSCLIVSRRRINITNPTFSQKHAMEWKSIISIMYSDPRENFEECAFAMKTIPLDYLKYIKGKTEEEVLDGLDSLFVTLLAMDFLLGNLTSKQTEALLKYISKKYDRPIQDVWAKQMNC